jgi:hypothetical protein
MTVPRAYPAEKAQTKFQHTIYIVGLAGTAMLVTFLAFDDLRFQLPHDLVMLDCSSLGDSAERRLRADVGSLTME